MRFTFTISGLLIVALNLTAQSPSFTISELPSMPEPVANNAVVSAMCGDTLCVYSFCGIDETKTPAGIHLKAWRYNTVTQIWSQLPDVPDDTGNGKIAAGASVVNNKIYVIGGYYVEDNFSEESSDDVHVFNPETNEWEEDGALIPVPIDDHVQAVWNEELIYIVTGWSDFGNVPDVQIYNPEENTWLVGTPTPNTGDYKVFGGSGEILGNRIIYHGGVRSAALGFFPTDEVRVGNINPLNPTDIQWELMGESEQGTTYRAAAIAIPVANSVFWIGGSALGYNFNGIDYNGTGGVEPTDKIIGFNGFTSAVTYQSQVIHEDFNVLPMDLRGIARVTTPEQEAETGNHQSIICGGIDAGQVVSNKVFLINSDNIVSVNEPEGAESQLAWSFTQRRLVVTSQKRISNINIFSTDGKLAESASNQNEVVLSHLESGIYITTVHFIDGRSESFRLFVDYA